MKLKHIFILPALLFAQNVWADEVVVKEYNYAGPFEVNKPFLADSLNVESKKFSEKELLNTTIPFDIAHSGGRVIQSDSSGELALPGSDFDYAIHLVSFNLSSEKYIKGSLLITGHEIQQVYINNKPEKNGENGISLTLEPQKQYTITIKYLSNADKTRTLKSIFKADTETKAIAYTKGKRAYTLSDVTDGKRIQSASISPDGNYLIVAYTETFPGGKQTSYTNLINRSNGAVVLSSSSSLNWMPRTNRAYYTRPGMKGKELVTIDPVSKAENVLVSNLPEGSFFFAPTEDYLLFSVREKGPEERKDVHEILVPDDRQPGWRNRTFIHRYDLRTGLFERLTYGHRSTMINDVSSDGRYLLFSCRESVLTERPFNRVTLYRMDMQTMQVDTILKSAKFVSRASFSPDNSRLLISGSGDAFDGIGLNIAEGQISNTSDGQLFIYNLADGQVTPLTKDFNPSIDRAIWNPFDKLIYAQAKDRDYVRVYTIDPVKGNIRQLPVQEEVVASISLAASAPVMAYFGMSVSNSQRLYAHDLRKQTSLCLEDLSKELLKDVQLGEVKDWNFVSAGNDTIYGRYYLPPNFDPTKKYPVIVNYYGGTTPTARVLESRYSSHVYAGLGFIVYILQPSGATGFGQEFSARHVNAWGKMTADEIIEGTKRFCSEHSFVDKDKVGCIGASYGGFMTMYLQTKTDIFASAISHAGISDITSYWGEGYWGYSYSALASADSYPWNAQDMYIGQSPLFSADKINTPILFLHGAADTNVPVGESIQMFTALKLLGKPTAFVQVEGENHHILHYDKRILWNQSIYSWFYKWLKDDPAWWDALYPAKSL